MTCADSTLAKENVLINLEEIDRRALAPVTISPEESFVVLVMFGTLPLSQTRHVALVVIPFLERGPDTATPWYGIGPSKGWLVS